jgi:6-phosphogluconate dehydrogenase
MADIGVFGLAVMGGNLARNFARHGHTVALHNRTQARTDAFLPPTERTEGATFRPPR